MTPETEPAPPRRKSWLSFRLRTLLIVAPLAAIAISWAFRAWYSDYLETSAAAEVQRLGGEVVRNDAHQIIEVQLAGREIDDARLAELVPYLVGLPKLKSVMLMSNDISDEGLLHLQKLTQVETVYLAGTKVTSDGVAQLNKRLPSLNVDLMRPHTKAMTLAARPVYKHAMVAVAASPRGEIVGGSGDGQVSIWDQQRGCRIASFAAHDDWTFSLAFHPGRNWLATGGGDELIKLWDWPTRREIARFEGHHDDVHAVRFTPDGQTLVSAGDDMTVRIWDVATRQMRHVLSGHSGTIPGLAISPDGTIIASASRDNTIRLWDIAEGKLLGQLSGHTDDVMSVDFQPAGKRLASASYDGNVIVWDLAAKSVVQTLCGHQNWAFAVAWSPDGKQLASAAGDGVRLWNANDGQLAWHTAHQANVSQLCWLDPGRFASSSADGSVVVQGVSGEAIVTMWPRLLPSGSELARNGGL
jgi:WD40 repeat protein